MVGTTHKCETNETLIIVIVPYIILLQGSLHENIEISISGEVDQVWYKLQAYGLTSKETITSFSSIEKKLISSWNSLGESQ